MTRCVRCTANVTNLSLPPVIAGHFGGAYDGRVAYELSTFGSTLKWLKRKFSSVTTSEFFPDKPLGNYVDGILNEDVQCLTFGDNSFDLVTHNQVFEHVPDDIRGFQEILRVLKPGGAMVASLPMHDIPATTRKAYLDAQGILKFISAPEYHDSRLGGPRSAPVFWHHSVHDVRQRLFSVGFTRAELVDVTICEVQRKPEKVIYAVK